jgi:hypothetical protein
MENSNIARELSFSSPRSKGSYKDLLDVLDSMIVVTHAIDSYHHGHQPMPALLDIIRARNAVQHWLLSLISPSFAIPVELATFTTCWLAAVIYSEMVLFPMPLNAAVKPRLAYMLRRDTRDQHSNPRNIKHDAAKILDGHLGCNRGEWYRESSLVH